MKHHDDQLAQCATCSGVLIAAGDDWTHLDDTGCTLLGQPILCERDCGYPAAIGAMSCPSCTAISLPNRYTATVYFRGRRENVR